MPNLEQYSELGEERQQQANNIIIRRTMYAGGTGLIPVPIVDAVALLGVQMYMLRDIANVYELEFKEQRVKSLISVLVGDVAAISLFKFIPGLGTFFGGASVVVMGAASTYALGKVFVKHFEEGGTFLNFDAVKSEEYFKTQVKEGKKVVKNLRKKSFVAFNKISDTKTKTENKATTTDLSNINQQSKKLGEEILALRKEIENLRQERSQNTMEPVYDDKVEKSIKPKKENLDDLQIIKGIGPKTAKILKQAGIQSITGLSKSTPERIHDILEKSEGNFKLAVPDNWILQAQLAAGGNLEALHTFQKKLSETK